MKPQTTSIRTASLLISFALCVSALWLNSSVTAQGGQVQVTAANPTAAEQGTVNLNVKVTGKGFKNGAKAQWFVTGTTNPGGVTVNSTTFVSSTEVDANITVADTATVANFDIAVTNSDGRGGKGTELFAVNANGNHVVCPAMQPAPTGDTRCYGASAGCLDTTFGGTGLVTNHFGDPAYSTAAEDIAVQPDGKIVVAAQARGSSSLADFAVARYNTDGSLDTSFGDPDPLNPPLRKGFVITAVTSNGDTPNAIALQADGKILAVGTANSDSAVVRYNTNGTLDGTFGNGGIDILNFGRRVVAPNRDIAIQSDGKLLVGGSSGSTYAVGRLLANGSADSTFGSGGLATATPTGASNASGTTIAIQRVPAVTGEERIVLGGTSTVNSSADTDWTLMRFRSTGGVDSTFGSAGTVKTAFFSFGDSIHQVAVDSANRIVASGNTRTASSNCGGYVIDGAVVRYTQDGALDTTFNGSGKQTVDVYGGMDQFYGLAIQADNKPVILSYSYSSDGTVKTLALARLNVDGSRDATFGPLANGIATFNPYGFDNYGIAVALQSDGKIVGAGSANYRIGGPWDVVVVRYWP
jgi:uncharacterized delta-60 repeat protein